MWTKSQMSEEEKKGESSSSPSSVDEILQKDVNITSSLFAQLNRPLILLLNLPELQLTADPRLKTIETLDLLPKKHYLVDPDSSR